VNFKYKGKFMESYITFYNYRGKEVHKEVILENMDYSDFKKILQDKTDIYTVDIKRALYDINKFTKQQFKSILLIDDDVNFLETMAQDAEADGHYVESYSNLDLIFSMIKRNPDRYDLIVVDYNMPNLRGDSLINVFNDFVTDCKMAILTGENRENLQGLGLKMHVFQKPCFVKDILKRLNS